MSSTPDENVGKRPLDRPLLELLGIEGHFLPEEAMPPVDQNRLRQYAQKELPEEEAREVEKLAASYRSWYDALLAAMRDE